MSVQMRTLILAPLAFVALPALAAAPKMPAPSAVSSSTNALLQVPVNSYNIIGERSAPMKNPYAGNKRAAAWGKTLFQAMNCAGCHSPGGGGGMGPALSDSVWIYGDQPGQIYLSIMQGRPGGMPSWGGALPPQAIWALVTYVKSLRKPGNEYAITTKLSKMSQGKAPKKAHAPKKQPPATPPSMYKKYPPAARTPPPAAATPP